MTETTHPISRGDSAYKPTWIAPKPADRDRVIEMSTRLEPAMGVVAAVNLLAATVTMLAGGYWALLSVVTAAVAVPLSRWHSARTDRPEITETLFGLAMTTSVALGAALTGGVSSPLAAVIPVSVVVGAARNSQRVVALTVGFALSVFTAVSFSTASHLTVAFALRMVVFVFATVAIGIVARVLSRAETDSRRAAVIDSLTGLLNRSGLEDRFEELRQQATLNAASLCVILFDLDHFKSVNDEHGHHIGDVVLRDIAYRVRTSVRRFELIYRVGGEEFLVVLPGMDEAAGADLAEQLRSVVEAEPVAGLDITASFGVSAATGPDIDFPTMYQLADEALYLAKEEGRNTVRTGSATHAARPQAPVPG